MQIAILIFDKLTALDAIGPYEVLRSVPGWEVTFVAAEKGEVRTDNGVLGLERRLRARRGRPSPTSSSSPAATATARCSTDEAMLDWLRAVDAHEQVDDLGLHRLAGARPPPGCSTGKRATSHWLCARRAAPSSAPSRSASRVVERRQDRHRRRRLGRHRHGAAPGRPRGRGAEVAQAIQLGIEYDPQPPFDAGSPEKAPGRDRRGWSPRSPARARSGSTLTPEFHGADGAGAGDRHQELGLELPASCNSGRPRGLRVTAKAWERPPANRKTRWATATRTTLVFTALVPRRARTTTRTWERMTICPGQVSPAGQPQRIVTLTMPEAVFTPETVSGGRLGGGGDEEPTVAPSTKSLSMLIVTPP